MLTTQRFLKFDNEADSLTALELAGIDINKNTHDYRVMIPNGTGILYNITVVSENEALSEALEGYHVNLLLSDNFIAGGIDVNTGLNFVPSALDDYIVNPVTPRVVFSV